MGSFFSSSDDEISSCSSIDSSMNSLIFHPPPNNEVHKIRNLCSLNSKNGNMIYYVKYEPIGTNRYVIFSHGNGCDISGMDSYYKFLNQQFNVGVIGYDYQGYGLSQGKPTEKTCYEDLESVINMCINEMHIDKKDIILIGHSLGTGVTVDYVSKHTWNTPIILISPYKTIATVATDTSCVAPIDKFTTIKKINKVNCPVKIFHGLVDDLINVTHAKEIYQKLNNKTFPLTIIDYCDHNNILLLIPNDELGKVLFY